MSSISTLPLFPKLNDSNYHIWKHNMQAHLLVKSLWGITSGDEAKPSDAVGNIILTLYGLYYSQGHFLIFNVLIVFCIVSAF